MLPLVALLYVSFLSFGCSASVEIDDQGPNVVTQEPNEVDDWAKVRFYNESSYSVSVYLQSFNGSELIDRLPGGQSKQIDVRASDDIGIGTMFSIVYWVEVDGISIKSIDPNMQTAINIKAGENYTYQIQNPKGLELRESFLRLLNTSTNSIQLQRFGMAFVQEGNKGVPVQVGETGVYKIQDKVSDYMVVQIFESYPMPSFDVENGMVYEYEFNGNQVRKRSEYSLNFGGR